MIIAQDTSANGKVMIGEIQARYEKSMKKACDSMDEYLAGKDWTSLAHPAVRHWIKLYVDRIGKCCSLCPDL